MTLEEYINITDKNVKLGTKGGSFLYCGNIKGLDTNMLDRESVLKRVSYIAESQVTLGRIERKLKRSEANYKKYLDSAIGVPMPYEKRLAQLEHDKIARTNGIENGWVKLAHHKLMKDRKVLETYPSITENACIVIIEGDEVGDYWSIEEYERSNK